jgi:hypothetical protein
MRPAATRRVLVFGDSVVGNVATPSWGPGNWLGWARRFGFLQATDVVLVISSHAAADNPSPEPFTRNPNHIPFSHPSPPWSKALSAMPCPASASASSLPSALHLQAPNPPLTAPERNRLALREAAATLLYRLQGRM